MIAIYLETETRYIALISVRILKAAEKIGTNTKCFGEKLTAEWGFDLEKARYVEKFGLIAGDYIVKNNYDISQFRYKTVKKLDTFPNYIEYSNNVLNNLIEITKVMNNYGFAKKCDTFYRVCKLASFSS